MHSIKHNFKKKKKKDLLRIYTYLCLPSLFLWANIHSQWSILLLLFFFFFYYRKWLWSLYYPNQNKQTKIFVKHLSHIFLVMFLWQPPMTAKQKPHTHTHTHTHTHNKSSEYDTVIYVGCKSGILIRKKSTELDQSGIGHNLQIWENTLKCN